MERESGDYILNSKQDFKTLEQNFKDHGGAYANGIKISMAGAPSRAFFMHCKYSFSMSIPENSARGAADNSSQQGFTFGGQYRDDQPGHQNGKGNGSGRK